MSFYYKPEDSGSHILSSTTALTSERDCGYTILMDSNRRRHGITKRQKKRTCGISINMTPGYLLDEVDVDVTHIKLGKYLP